MTLRVVQRLAGGQWQVSVGGKLVSVSSDVELSPGAVVRAIVERSAGRILLRIVPEPLSARVAQSLGIPDSPALRAAVGALARSHMALGAEQVAGVLRTLARAPRQDGAAARLVALLHDRGLSLTSGQLEELMLAVEGVGGREAGGRRRDGREGHRERERPAARQRVRRRSPEERKAVGEALQYFCSRAAEVGDHVVQLFNHMPAGHEQWLVIPFGYDIPDGEGLSVEGSLRLRVGRATGAGAPGGADRARLFARCGGAAWLFAWDIGQQEIEGRRMKVYADAGLSRRELETFRKAVRSAGFLPPEEILPLSASDGFTEIEGETVPRGVDERM